MRKNPPEPPSARQGGIRTRMAAVEWAPFAQPKPTSLG